MRTVIAETKLEQKVDDPNGVMLDENCQNSNSKPTISLPTIPIFNFHHHTSISHFIPHLLNHISIAHFLHPA